MTQVSQADGGRQSDVAGSDDRDGTHLLQSVTKGVYKPPHPAGRAIEAATWSAPGSRSIYNQPPAMANLRKAHPVAWAAILFTAMMQFGGPVPARAASIAGGGVTLDGFGVLHPFGA